MRILRRTNDLVNCGDAEFGRPLMKPYIWFLSRSRAAPRYPPPTLRYFSPQPPALAHRPEAHSGREFRSRSTYNRANRAGGTHVRPGVIQEFLISVRPTFGIHFEAASPRRNADNEFGSHRQEMFGPSLSSRLLLPASSLAR